MRRRSVGSPSWIAATVAAVTGALAVAWTVAIDLLAGTASTRPIPCALALAPAGLLALLSWTPVCGPRSKWPFRVAFLLTVLVVAATWNARKRFVRDVFSVRVGMSVDDVEAVMGKYSKGAGPSWELPFGPEPQVGEAAGGSGSGDANVAPAPGPYHAPEYPTGPARRFFTGTMIHRWSTEPRYNSDWGLVQFHHGKVVKVDFLPD